MDQDYASFARTHYPHAFARHVAGCASGARPCSQEDIVTRLGGRWHSVAAATPAPTTLEHDVSPRVTVSHAQAPCQGPGKTVLAKTTRRRRSHRCVKCKGPGDEVLLQSKRRHRSVETRLETRIRGKPQSPVEEGWPVIAW